VNISKEHKFPYEWRLADGYPAKGIAKNGLKVFSCFSCGGGSTMGYKLAGFDVIGCNEIDPRMMEVYKANHNPKYSFLEGIQTFKDREDLPEELYDLDILDGSPPCSSFSMAGSREDAWGKEKKFREGQTEQVLDTLFFDFIALADKLKPKVVVAENVKGLLQGSAFEYVKKIYQKFNDAGYYVQHFLLDGSKMGIPQKRERVFFVCIRRDLAQPFIRQVDMFTYIPYINLEFKERSIPFKDVEEKGNFQNPLSEYYMELWEQRQDSDLDFSCINGRVRNKPNTGFGATFAKRDNVCGTLTSKKDCYVNYHEGRYLSDLERQRIGSYPLDYNFLLTGVHYLIGMSVPPVMTAQIAHRIYEQWLSKIPQQSELKKAS
jgi:DNA (cytosine-5)-methyltransferase 1